MTGILSCIDDVKIFGCRTHATVIVRAVTGFFYCTCTVRYCTCFHLGSHRQVGAIHLDKVFMATRDATCIAPGFGTGNGREKMEKRENGIWGLRPYLRLTE
jgi:hypothetical protein